ncbi:hypothetical protein E2C01_055170 [Portunus trituberculatus]|uniref:Uncharacterized protein n=1 Tax=Portunus trituberculatus TaxID=210409 RepID=A0A5B7GV85_PORTR|nr:hypothetical protein [Portunus trituberculatus]
MTLFARKKSEREIGEKKSRLGCGKRGAHQLALQCRAATPTSISTSPTLHPRTDTHGKHQTGIKSSLNTAS